MDPMKDRVFSFFILLPFIWLSTGMLILKNGDKTMVAMIIISIIATVCRYGLTSIKQNLSNKMLWLVIAIAAYTLFSYAYHGLSSRELRAIIGSLLFLLFLPTQLITQNRLIGLVVLGSIVSSLYAWYYGIYLGLGREWPINPIPYSTLIASFAIMSLGLMLANTNKLVKLLTLLAFLCCCFALIIGETRGIWLATLVALIAIATYNMIKFYQPKYWLYLGGLTLLLIIAGFAVKPQIEQRIVQTEQEYQAIQSGNLCTSIGLRLQMWQAASILVEDDPIFGLGDGHLNKINALYKQHRVSQCLYDYQPPHYHNQYLDRFVKNGAIGALLLLGLLLVPLKNIKLCTTTQQYFLVGIISVYASASLTDVPLNHGQTLFMYFFYIFGVGNCLPSPQRELNS